MNNSRRGIVISNGFMFLHGLATVMIGTTLPEIIRSFDLSYSRAGLVVSARSAGSILIMAVGMLFADRVNKPLWIVGSMFGSGILIAATGLAPEYWYLGAVFFATGIFVRLLDGLLNAVVGDLRPLTRTRSVAILHTLYGIGAFVGPSFARILLDVGLHWEHVYRIVGGTYVAAVLISLFWFKTFVALGRKGVVGAAGSGSVHERQTGWSNEARSATSTGAWTIVTFLGVSILFYGLHQLSINSWLPTYMQSVLGSRTRVASLSLSLYWIGIILSRILSSVVGGRIGEIRILIWGSLLGGVAMIIVVAVGNPAIALAGFLLGGILTGAVIPLAMSVAYGIVPSRTGTATSILYFLLVAGRLVGPWMVGAVGDRWGLSAGLILAAAPLVLSAACVLVISRMPAMRSAV